MKKPKVINLPVRHPAIGEENAVWLVLITSGLKDCYSCEYDTENDNWKLTIKSSTFRGAEVLAERCRNILGWDAKKAENAAEN